MTFSTRFPVGKRNANGHIYPIRVMAKALEGAQERIAAGRFLVHYVSSPAGPWPPDLHSAVGVVRNAHLDKNEVVLEIEALPSTKTPLNLDSFDFRLGGQGTVKGGKVDPFSFEYILACLKGEGA